LAVPGRIFLRVEWCVACGLVWSFREIGGSTMGLMKTIATELSVNHTLAGDSREMMAMREARRRCFVSREPQPARIVNPPVVTCQAAPEYGDELLPF
jgi:hypothetical protein